jgi:transposase-like protein
MNKKEQLRPRRIFSEPLKKQAVSEIEDGKCSVLQIARINGVSYQAVYGWLNKYSRYLQSGKTMVIQMESEAAKNAALQKRILELEAALGRKQLEVDFLNKMIEIGKEELGVDLKKKFSTPPSTGSGQTENNTDTK